MKSDKITIAEVKSISKLEVVFNFSESNILVITGKNGAGKTSLVKAFSLIDDPQIFQRSSGNNSIKNNSFISFEVEGFEPFSFQFNEKLRALDSKDKLPSKGAIVAELSIPYGKRFQQFSLISEFDGEIRSNIAASRYSRADELISFLKSVYANDKFEELKVTKVKRYNFYFIVNEDDYYIREDHLSSGEFFLIQLYRLITSGAQVVLVDEVDVALDAAAQVRLYKAIKPILREYNTRVILISHSLAFMSTVKDGGLYYLEDNADLITLEQRSFGYIKSDLYGFIGRDKYIITEDETLSGFLKYLVNKHIRTFFQYEIIGVGGEPQIRSIIKKNDEFKIFGEPEDVIVVVDKDIYDKVNIQSASKLYSSPVDDIEVFIWQNREFLLPDVEIESFRHAEKEKKTAKTYWGKVISSGQKTTDDLFELVEINNIEPTTALIQSMKELLCLSG